MNKKKMIDSRSEKGITIGLIDSLISTARVLAPRIVEASRDEFGDDILHALQDLVQDSDILTILRAVSSRYIITEDRAEAWEAIINGMKK